MSGLGVRTIARVSLYSSNRAITKYLTDWLSGEGVDLSVVTGGKPPARADVLLTTTSLSRAIEVRAARLGAMPAVVPEALDYVVGRIRDGKVATLVAYDFHGLAVR
ncbi:hypothetical protein SEA_CAFASSO_44 [Gordonia phage Cafasso]|uniref:Uncharacterized protein n=1 Tax=Gordonia phage Cafasso TaxID=2851095 RepID=A0AAE7SK07_9CAUD|nr:hypothetical protein SEA_CAFASSO_44 [Gordonia phage Cafasso]